MQTTLARALAVTLISALPITSAVLAAEEKLTVVADEWPPFSGQALPGKGISLDVIRAVLERAGYEVEARVLPWARIMDGAPKGEYDIVGSLFYDADIASYMTYTEPFYETEVKFVRKSGSEITVSGLDSLRPYSIAVGDGFLYEPEFDRADHLNKIVVTTALQALQMVAYGRAELTLDSEEVLRISIREGGAELSERLEILDTVLATHNIHAAVRSDLPGVGKLIADFNRTLAEMRADGSLAEILAKHRID